MSHDRWNTALHFLRLSNPGQKTGFYEDMIDLFLGNYNTGYLVTP